MRGLPVPLAVLVLLGALSAAVAQDAGAEPPAMINPNPLSSLSLDGLTATRSLPLFTPSRTAPAPEPEVQADEPPPPVEAAADPEQPPPPVELIGIVLTDETQTALLRDPASNEVHRLTNGDDLQGWALTILDSRSIELRSGDRVQGLKMFETFASPAGQTAPQEPFDESQPPPPPPLLKRPGQDARMSQPDPSQPAAGDIVKGGNSLQSDTQEVPPAAEPPPSGSEAPPPEVAAPAADFAPRHGNSPIPEEGAPGPERDGINQ